ncbi:uncharacterized protein LOC111492989 [Cucurbita maxima]|uniref:Uncharacterized protein LOC111492989 n=1 Tax=Cucurbita maxima TaxID=3661 RepID=A0A6J1K9X5_CUCMA|nr:uncharacterized protein LOC111492989 [Cucurbita maxima]
MASQSSLYFSLLFFLLSTAAIVAAFEARNIPANPISSTERHDEMIGLRDYGDARANHRHEPHHPLGVEGYKKELDD